MGEKVLTIQENREGASITASRKTLVIGLGNPIISDDSIGFQVIEVVRGLLAESDDVAIKATSLSGLHLLDFIEGYDKVIVVDSIVTQNGQPGTVYRLALEDLETGRHTATIHDIGLAGVIELGKRNGLAMPSDVVLIAIEADDITTFSPVCTAAVAAAIPRALDLIAEELKTGISLKINKREHRPFNSCIR